MSHSGWQKRWYIIIGCALLAGCAGTPRRVRGGDVVLPSSGGGAGGFLASLLAQCGVTRTGLAPADTGRAAACAAQRVDTAAGAVFGVGEPPRRRP